MLIIFGFCKTAVKLRGNVVENPGPKVGLAKVSLFVTEFEQYFSA